MKTLVGLERIPPAPRCMVRFILSHSVLLYSTVKFDKHVPNDYFWTPWYTACRVPKEHYTDDPGKKLGEGKGGRFLSCQFFFRLLLHSMSTSPHMQVVPALLVIQGSTRPGASSLKGSFKNGNGAALIDTSWGSGLYLQIKKALSNKGLDSALRPAMKCWALSPGGSRNCIGESAI